MFFLLFLQESGLILYKKWFEISAPPSVFHHDGVVGNVLDCNIVVSEFELQ